MKKMSLILFLLLFQLCRSLEAAESVIIASPIDLDGYQTVVSDATAATTNPYRPSSAGTAAISMKDSRTSSNFTGFQIRAKYVSGSTLTTDPVLAAFGKKGSGFALLKDTAGNRTTTLTDTTNDVSDGTNAWTDNSNQIDALGSEVVLVTIVTAAVASSGAVTIELTRF
jgi:hypothetical protein